MKIIFIFIFSICSIYKLTAQPTISWQKCYGGSANEGVAKIIRTQDNGYLFMGSTASTDGDVNGLHVGASDAWVVKLDSLYNIQWQKCLGGGSYDWAVGAVETTGGYVIGCAAGSIDGDITNSHGLTDFWFVKLDSAGSIVWQHCYGGSLFEDPYDIAATPDGGFIMSGYALSFDGDVVGHHGSTGQNDFWLVKVDSNGTLLWSKCLGGTVGEAIGVIDVDSMGNIYGACTSGSRDGDVTCNGLTKSVWIVKLDPLGNIIWDKCYGGSGNGTVSDEIFRIQVENNKLFLTGRTASSDFDLSHNYGYWDAWLLVTDTAGNVKLSQSYGGSQYDAFYCAQLINNSIIVAGYSYSNDYDVTSNHIYQECWILELDSLGTILWQNTYGGNSADQANWILADSNKILMTALTSSTNGDVIGNHGNGDAWLAELNLYTAINELQNANNYSLYPNPFYSTFNISIKTPINESCSIYLYDAMGRRVRTVKENEIVGNTNLYLTVNANSLPSGLYYVSISTATASVVKKVVKL